MPDISLETSSDYWDGVGRNWREQQPDALWREFTDAQQLELLQGWLPPLAGVRTDRSITLLKTDLFDEVAHRGLVQPLQALGMRVVGIDLSPLIVAEAQVRNPDLEAQQADVRRLPFQSGSFDVVFSGSTLDHLDSATAIGEGLVEIARVLRPGGQLILTMDNPANPLIYLRNGPLLALGRKLGIVPYQVGATLVRAPLLRAVQAAGFEILATRAVQHCPRLLAVPLAGLIGRLPRRWQRRYLGLLAGCEVGDRLVTRWQTAQLFGRDPAAASSMSPILDTDALALGGNRCRKSRPLSQG